jgi:hypothetical protein
LDESQTSASSRSAPAPLPVLWKRSKGAQTAPFHATRQSASVIRDRSLGRLAPNPLGLAPTYGCHRGNIRSSQRLIGSPLVPIEGLRGPGPGFGVPCAENRERRNERLRRRFGGMLRRSCVAYPRRDSSRRGRRSAKLSGGPWRFPPLTSDIWRELREYADLIGATGFEPATFRPPVECATKLRHAPRHASRYSAGGYMRVDGHRWSRTRVRGGPAPPPRACGR